MTVYLYSKPDMPKRDASDANLSPKGETAKSNKMEGEDSIKGAIGGLKITLQKDVEALSQKIGHIYTSQADSIDAVQSQGGFIETVSSRLIDMERREIEETEKLMILRTSSKQPRRNCQRLKSM